MKIKKGDKVIITAGKDKGKIGEVSKVFPKKNKLTVKNANLYKRHLKSREGIEGGIFEIERPLPVSNVALICPTCKKPTRVGYQTPPKGNKQRICKKCQSVITTKLSNKSKPKKTNTKKAKTKK